MKSVLQMADAARPTIFSLVKAAAVCRSILEFSNGWRNVMPVHHETY